MEASSKQFSLHSSALAESCPVQILAEFPDNSLIIEFVWI